MRVCTNDARTPVNCLCDVCACQVRAALPSTSDSVPSLPSSAAQLLQLAEGMAARQANKAGKVESFEALLVYIDLLLARQQPQQALAIMTGPVGQGVAAASVERGALQADLHALCGDRDVSVPAY